MKTLRLPRAHQAKLSRIIKNLEFGECDYRAFRGKRLQQNPRLVSIGLGKRWRALFIEVENGFRFRGCFSHEQYNKLKFNQIH